MTMSSTSPRARMPLAASLHCWAMFLAAAAACGSPLPASPVNSPTAVESLPQSASQMDDLALTEDGACGVFVDGTARCWGRWEASMFPLNVSTAALADVVELRIGDSFVGSENQLLSDFFCARLSSGEVQCWGNGYQGQLGSDVGAWGASMAPAAVGGMPPNVTSLALGERHACAVTAAGGAVCWGSNEDGQLGLGPVVGDKVVRPSAVRLPGKVIQVVATNRGTCALLADGDVYCWGEAGEPEANAPRVTWWPKRSKGARGIRLLSAATSTVCGIRFNGSIACWGHVSRDIDIVDGGPADVLGIADAAAIAVGFSHACAIRHNATLWCWGAGNDGELGDGRRISSRQPVQVPLPDTVVRVTAGSHATCAQLADRRWFCWGANRNAAIAPRGIGTISSPRLLDLSEL